ncbi:MAG: DUF6878 family protein [Paracoccaceae bacterium]
MIMTNRYSADEIQLGMQTLKEFLDDLKPLDALPEPKPPSMDPETYMCAANMAALMVTYDDGRYVCDIGFRKAPAVHPQLLGIVGAPGSGFSTTREIGKSLVLDVLYGAIEPADVRLLSDDQATDIEGKDSSLRGNVGEQEPGEARKSFVTYEGKQYEVVRKFMQRKLSFAEPAEREATQKLIEKYKADQAKPMIMTDEEIEQANLETFYCALMEAGITGFIGFNDCYDEDGGQLEGIRAFCGQKLVELPAFDVQWAEKNPQGRQGETFHTSIRAALNNIVDDVLRDIQIGYDLVCGAHFRFSCDVRTRKFHIKLRGWDHYDQYLELDFAC